ncbi:hypothetical protein, partial [Acinetobacter baumannii]|uniref:hypothetical protein n=1 Tax=Acinetobacter baumannii TaxID=470 RepID=UPI003F68945F
MVLKPDPIFRAVESLAGTSPSAEGAPQEGAGASPRVILLCPQGKRYDQKLAEELAREEHLI